MALPKVVYVYEEDDSNGGECLLAIRKLEERSEGLVGVYDLRETLRVRTQTQVRRAKTKTWFTV